MSITGRQVVGLSFIAVLGIVFVSYMFDDTKPPAPTTSTSATVIQLVDEGNGIYYFPVVGEQYRQALVRFFGDYPEMNCSYLGPTEKHMGGGLQRINGHILRCRDGDTATPAQDVTVP